MRTLLSVLLSGWVLWMNTGFADEFPVGKDHKPGQGSCG